MSAAEREWVADYRVKAEDQLKDILSKDLPHVVKRKGRMTIPTRVYRDTENILTLS
jgi:hypothetical protein